MPRDVPFPGPSVDLTGVPAMDVTPPAACAGEVNFARVSYS